MNVIDNKVDANVMRHLYAHLCSGVEGLKNDITLRTEEDVYNHLESYSCEHLIYLMGAKR